MFEVKVPEICENSETGNIISIAVSVGDTVKKGQDLFKIRTDKRTFLVSSSCGGAVEDMLIKEGDKVKAGQTVMKITESTDNKAPVISPAKAATFETDEAVSGPAKIPFVGKLNRESGSVFQLPDFSKWGNIERVSMNNIRKITASHLSRCWQEIPHVTQFDKADITELEKARKEHSTKDRKLTITPFLLKTLAAALKQFPQFNASIDMEAHEVIYKKYFHIGVAVDTEKGLIVPVIRDVDKKSVFELADELAVVAQRARDKKISLEELRGRSITLTNLGGIGGINFTPIVNWPDVAIWGVSRSKWEQVYEKDQFVVRLMLPLSLSYDHRLIDGADGARFLRWICETIQQTNLIKI